jgi:alpha-glucosidase
MRTISALWRTWSYSANAPPTAAMFPISGWWWNIRLVGSVDDSCEPSLLTGAGSRLRVLIEDAEQSVYQIPTPALSLATGQGKIGDSLLTFNFTKNPFAFSVARVLTGEILFDTAISPLIFESQYIRLQTRLPRNPNIYGLGEHSDSFRLPIDEYIRTFWNVESPYIPQGNLYGSHPVYFEHRSTGTHGVFLANSNGMDVKISKTQWTRYLEYSILGGVLDFYFLAGPDPTSVSQQYAELVGLPAMIPYWTLGFHQCKYGWPSIDHVSAVVAEYSAAQIPLEAIWGDIDYMDRRRDFTTDPKRYPLDKVRAFVDQLHRNGQRYVQILDPGIHNEVGYGPYDRGAQQGVFLRSADGSFYRGRQWPGEVVWPDWLAPGTEEWWINEIRYFYNPYTGIDVDGLWVDMNEASNMCLNPECVSFWTGLSASMEPVEPSTTIHQAPSGTTWPGAKRGLPGRDLLNPRYRIGNRHGSISTYTLATNITNADGTAQYDTHNLYGSMMAAATRKALLARRPNVRPFVLTRSTFAGTGRIAAHCKQTIPTPYSPIVLSP